MPQDPFHGRVPSEGSPYDNAMAITPSDTIDLPVIPSAIMVQPFLPIYSDAEGVDSDTPSDDPTVEWNRYPYSVETVGGRTTAPNFILMEMQDGSRVSVWVPTLYDLSRGIANVIEMRPKRILRTGTTFRTLTLLW